MKYIKSQMKQLIKENKELHTRLKELKKEHGLEKNIALKALYHSEVAEGGKYQAAYQAMDAPKD
jgi:23S rRNA C2498 (ribose-2'-O)-methylase RlmM